MSLPLVDANGIVQTVDGGTPVSWNAGLGYANDGRLCVISAVTASDSYSGGRRVASNGALVVSAAGATPYLYNAGWPADNSTGAVIVQSGTPLSTDPRVAGVAVNENGIFVTEGAAPRVAAPVFSPQPPGNFGASAAITITSATAGATIRYTVNGVPPTSTTGTVYSGPVTLTANSLLQAIAYNGVILDSSVTSGNYAFVVAMPTFLPVSGVYASAQSVVISTTTAGASIRYTTDGSSPSPTVGTIYTAPVDVSATMSIKAIAYLANWNSSAFGVANYSIGTGSDFMLTSDDTLDFLNADSGAENLLTDMSVGQSYPYVGLWNYSAPPTASIPNPGEIIHGDNFVSKMNVSKLDISGNVIDLAQMQAGDTVLINGTTYIMQAPVQMFDSYAALSIDPTTQQPDGPYTVTVDRP